MPIDGLFQPLAFARGPAMKNRLMLAPMTNQQSHGNGTLSDAELRWLDMRAEGGFGLVATAGAYVTDAAIAFVGQLGVSRDMHIPGLSRLADALRRRGALSSLQLLHAGSRAQRSLGGEPVSCTKDETSGTRALSLSETERLRDAYIGAAERAEKAGFDGIELHGAHGYLLGQYLSGELNLRKDRYGGSLKGRSRLLFEIIDGVRAACNGDFQIGVRLSAEHFGVRLAESIEVAKRLFMEGKIDYLDMSLWDAFKEPAEEGFQGRSLLSYFTSLDRGRVRLAVAGKIYSATQAASVLEQGADIAVIGRAAILHHDYPELVRNDDEFSPASTPVTAGYLARQGLSPAFIDYLDKYFPGFVGKRETRSMDQADWQSWIDPPTKETT